MRPRGRFRTGPGHRRASFRVEGRPTVPSLVLGLAAAAIAAAGCVAGAAVNAARFGTDGLPVSLGVTAAVLALAVWKPNHATLVPPLLLMLAAYASVSAVAAWTLPPYVLGLHVVYVLLGVRALAPSAAVVTGGALAALARAALPVQAGAQALAALALGARLLPAGSGPILGTVAGMAAACVLCGAAYAAVRIARRAGNPE